MITTVCVWCVWNVREEYLTEADLIVIIINIIILYLKQTTQTLIISPSTGTRLVAVIIIIIIARRWNSVLKYSLEVTRRHVLTTVTCWQLWQSANLTRSHADECVALAQVMLQTNTQLQLSLSDRNKQSYRQTLASVWNQQMATNKRAVWDHMRILNVILHILLLLLNFISGTYARNDKGPENT